MATAIRERRSDDTHFARAGRTRYSAQLVAVNLTDSANAVAPPQGDFFILGPIAPGWMVICPISARIEQDEDGSFIVSDDLFLVYGHGQTPYEAQHDYITGLIEYYEILAADAEAPSLAMFRDLQRYLRSSHL